MESADVLVVGSGPAGLTAACTAAQAGAHVVLVDRHLRPGGQLFKQTHKFFGSARHYAGLRGFQIASRLIDDVSSSGVEVRLGTVVWSLDSLVASLSNGSSTYRLRAGAVVVATGSQERALPFPGWTLPGVMGAGAAQTMMHLHRVLPGERTLIVGAGNVGLIVAYQLLQAGADVVAVIDSMPVVKGYSVHAAKLLRHDVPILTEHSIVEAVGEQCVERAKIAQVDASSAVIAGTGAWLSVDTICLAVGLMPLCDLLWLAGAEFIHLDHLGGFVPVADDSLQSTAANVFVAGDASGIEEASVAMEQGRLAGLSAASAAGHRAKDFDGIKAEALQQIAELRSGPGTAQVRTACAEIDRAARGGTASQIVRQSLAEPDCAISWD